MHAEQLRHQYLEALGVSSWLPREPLAGARVSQDWVWQFQQGVLDDGEGEVDAGGGYEDDYEGGAAEQSTVVQRPVRRGGAPAGAGRTALLDSLDATPAAPASVPAAVAVPPADVVSPAGVAREPVPAAPVAAVAAPAQGSDAVPRPRRSEPQVVPEFKLAFLAMGDGLIIDSLPPQSRGGFSNAHLRLAMSLWRGLGMPAVESPRAQLLPWPAFTSRSLDQGWDQAQTAVQRKFDLMLAQAQAPVRFVLLLGDSAARLLLQSPDGGDGMRGMLFRPRAQVPALATASLSEMLQVPGCKRDVWRELQPLIRHLADA